MNFKHLASVTLAFTMAAFIACDEDDDESGGGQEGRICSRLDECNYFGAGVSVGDCTDVLVMCTEELVSSAQQDWRREANQADRKSVV